MSDKKTILLVEDNELNRDMMVRRLKRAGLKVLTAGDGQSALDLMVSDTPDLVLMDMSLPILDGWSACRKARKDKRIKQIPIIALTAHALEEDRVKALAAGCDDYATKPVDFPELIEKIKALCTQ